MASRYDAVIIGAGVGGLAAAIVLGSAGRRCLVLEADARPGGKAGVVTLDGVEADTGPSVLTLPDVFADLLRLAGMELRDHLALRAPAPGFRYLYPDGVSLDVHSDLAATLASVRGTLGLLAEQELAAFLGYAERIWQSAAPDFVYGPAPSIAGLLRRGLYTLVALRRIDPFSVMQAAIHERVRSPHLRLLLARYATYNGSDPRRAPATLNCIAHVELALGGYGVTGGIYQLVQALAAAALRTGAELRCGAAAAGVLLRGGAACGVELADGSAVLAPVVICNGDVAGVREGLLPPAQRRVLAPPRAPSMSGYTAILRARRRQGARARVAHTVLFPADYDQEFADIFDRDRPPLQPTVYLCAQEACHGRRGWAAEEPVFVMTNAPAEPAGGARAPSVWQELAERVRSRLLQAGLCDPDDAVAWQRTPGDLAARFAGSRGSIYGAAANDMLAAFRRPQNAVPGVPGLFLASGSAHPGGGLPLAALSGRAAAQAALKRER